MTTLSRMFATGLLVIGGGLVALGGALFAFITIAYVEWDAAMSSIPATAALMAIPSISGIILIAFGEMIRASDGIRTAVSAMSIWLVVVGACLLFSPTFNLIWATIHGASFTAPGAPVSPYLGSMGAGITAVMVGILIPRLNTRQVG